jgi:hypothetical protein
MNDQPLPPNSAGAGERPVGVGPESLPQTGGAEVPRSESASAAGGAPAGPSGASAKPLSRDDVTAAIAAMPGGTPPAASSGTVPVPATADDVDVIEPEWVNKAEAEVQKHAGDPYGEEEAIEDLQTDYLQKRYGYKVGDPNASTNADKDKPEGA